MRRLAALLLALACASVAGAAFADDVRASADAYFDAENVWNGVYVGLGATAIASGVALATRDDDGFRAAGYPVLAIGGIQLVSGIVYLALTPGWRSQAEAQIEAGDIASERERMQSVEGGFMYYKLAEGLVAVTGLVVGIVGAVRNDDLMMGAGTGLGCAAMTQLTMEHITHDVAKDYLRALRRADATARF
jgi:hypothetical protein